MINELTKIARELANSSGLINYKIGQVPGSIDLKLKSLIEPEIDHIKYNSEIINEYKIDEIPCLSNINDKGTIDWILINGFGNDQFLSKVEQNLELHKLALEDILNPKHPPKLEVFDGALLLILRIILPNDDEKLDRSISIVICENALILFSPFNKFSYSKELLNRLKKKRGVIRDRGVDYLLFAILDIVIDSYFPRVELISSSIKEIDQKIFEGQDEELLKELKAIRQVLNIYFDNLYPLMNILTRFTSDEYEFIKEENYKYYRNCYDHVNYLCERINRLRESTSDIMNLNISINGQKMNEIMKVLTIMSSIFIPLSFICGLYGMNFDSSKSPLNMPELGWYYGYPFVLGIMCTLIFGMLFYFYKKKWI